ELRRAVRRRAAQVVPQRQVVQGDRRRAVGPVVERRFVYAASETVRHERASNRAVTAWPWAGRSSAVDSATTCPATSFSAASVYSTTWMPRRKVCTLSPEECRAQPAVGSTWLEPAQ